MTYIRPFSDESEENAKTNSFEQKSYGIENPWWEKYRISDTFPSVSEVKRHKEST